MERISPEGMKNLLSQAVAIDSVTPNEQQVTNFFEDALKQRGFTVQRQHIDDTDRTNLFAEKGEGATVLFYGHMDTVSMGNLLEWRTDPLKMEEENGKLYGRGASDMKGGIVAFIEAAANSVTPVKIFLAVDEEAVSEGAWKAVSERKVFFDDIELIISGEPSFNLGSNSITTGRTGRCIYEVTFKGKPEHVIRYREAIDALKKLSDFGHMLYAKREEMFRSSDTVAQLRRVYGESRGMSVCGEAVAEIEVILGAEDTTEGVQDKLQKIAEDEVRVKPRKTPYLEGYHFKTFPHRDVLTEIIRKHTGKEIELRIRKSVGDDNVLATLKIPVITWGPEGGNEHAPNEYVDFNSLVILSKMYKEFLDSIGDKK